MNKLICPHCGSTDVSESDCFDIETTFDYNRCNEVILRKISGYCDGCGATDLLWTEVYEFAGYDNIMANE